MENNKYKLFLEQSKFNAKSINKSVLKHVEIDTKQSTWTFHIHLPEVIDTELLPLFLDQIKTYFLIPKVVKKVFVQLSYDHPEGFEPLALKYLDYVIYEVSKEKPSAISLKNFKATYENQTYTFAIDEDSTYINQFFKLIQMRFARFGFIVQFKTEIVKDMMTVSKEIEHLIKEKDDVLAEQAKQAKRQKQNEKPAKYGFTRKSNPEKIDIKDIPIDQYRLDQYKNEKGDTQFLVEGQISKIDVRKLTNTSLLTFVLGDEEDAIYVKRFLRREKDFQIVDQLKEGDLVQVEGNANFDTFIKDVVLFANQIYFVEKPKKLERLDKAKEKRIEFHVHTKMSNMDAVTDVKSYIDQAIKWGHKAIAFTDHNGLYAYPDIFKQTKGKPIKPIYGVELDFVDETIFKITSEANEDIELKNATYVVFDIETTGLSAMRDKIIEIGAVKIQSGQVTETYQQFVNPEEAISDLITNLTSITDDMLKDQPLIDTVLPEFLAFIKGSVLVAHNALFDIGHIREKARQLDLAFDDSKAIDTLNLARYFYADQLKRFNLKAVSKLFKVKLDNHHRAIDDAQATAQIWLQMLSDLSSMGIKRFDQINEAIDPMLAYKHIIPSHINILTANQVGYKNLFKLVSDALTTHFHHGARALKGVVNTYREGLLIGSGCYKGEVFEAAINRSDDDLAEVMSFYDYVEIQPVEAYFHLFENLGSYAKDIIQATLHKIVLTAKKLNKIIIASGDVHYLEKSDVLYREIYIRTPLVGGGVHDLNKTSKMPEHYLLTTDEMLKAMAFLGKELAYEITVANTQKLNDLIDPIDAFPQTLYSISDDAFKDLLNIESISAEVERLVSLKMHELYGETPHPMVLERVSRELKNIIENEFAPVYYMSHLLVKKSLEDGYLVGSRGSVGSSLVATLLEITEVNPLRPHYRCPSGDFQAFYLNEEEIHQYGLTPEQKAFQSYFKDIQSGYDLPTHVCPLCGSQLHKDGHDIPFETFLGFDGDKVPDIDLNFSGDYQAIAHEYVRELLGEDFTFRAGTIQTVAERNAYGYVKGYLEDKHIEARNAQIERLANKIEGVKRSTGQHPGGIVVVPKHKTIYDVTPIQFPADDVTSTWKTTHFDYHSFEANLLKLDILGHDDPTMIKYLMDYVKAHPAEFPFKEAQDIPLDDPKVYKLFSGTQVIGLTQNDVLSDVASYAIPEFGTPFTRQMLSDTKPNTFAGLVKISGLSHGTDVWIKNAQSLVNGTTPYGKIAFEQIIACRDDIMVQLSQRGLEPLKAFDIMEFVRKGKPSKDHARWLTYEQEMRKYNVPEWYIWSAGQIKYMFPKAHATAYVIMAMRIAWFKVYKPLLFYSGFFSKRAVQFDYELMMLGSNAMRNKLLELGKEKNLKVKDDQLIVTLGVALEMTKRGFQFLPVDINLSEATTFKMEKTGLRMPFSAIDGLGASVALDIIENRVLKPFTSKEDVKVRTKINKTVFEKMENYGAFKDLNEENDVIEHGLFAL
ncbi:MAG: PolC-type DNA polymerase III [Acholeplasmataceae bacterium]